MKAFKENDFEQIQLLQKEISQLSNIYNIGEDFVTTIKVAVAEKHGYLEAKSRNFGGELNAEQIKM